MDRRKSIQILSSPRRTADQKYKLVPHQMNWMHWINQRFMVTPRLFVPIISSAICIVYWVMLLVAQFVEVGDDSPWWRDLGFVSFSSLSNVWQIAMLLLPEILCFPLGVLTFVMLSVCWGRSAKAKKGDGLRRTGSVAVENPTSKSQPLLQRPAEQDQASQQQNMTAYGTADQRQHRHARTRSRRRTIHLRQRDSITGELHRVIAEADNIQSARQSRQSTSEAERPPHVETHETPKTHHRMSSRLEPFSEDLFADRNISLLEGLTTSRESKRARRRTTVRFSRDVIQRYIQEQEDTQPQPQEQLEITGTEERQSLEAHVVHQGSINVLDSTIRFDPDAILKTRPNVSNFSLILVLFLCLVTGSVYPSLFASLFFLVYIGAMIFFSWKIRTSVHIRLGMIMLVGCHSSLILLAMALSRFELLQMLVSDKYAQMFGFMDFATISLSKWQGYAFVLSLFMTFTTCCTVVNQWISEVQFYLIKNEDIVKMVDMRHYAVPDRSSVVSAMKKEHRRLMITLSRLFKRISKGITQVLGIFTLLIMLTISISFPSALGGVLLLFLYFGFLVPSHVFHKTLPLVMLFTILVSVTQYSFNVPNVFSLITDRTALDVLERVGLSYLSDWNSVLFFLHGVLIFAAAITFRSRLKYDYETYITGFYEAQREEETRPLMQRNDTGSESSEHEEHSNNDANETRDVQQQLMRADTHLSDIHSIAESHMKKKLHHYLNDMYNFASNMVHIFISILIKHSYYLTLGIVYFATLTSNSSDVLHFIHLVLFIFFFISPGLARRLWVILLLYVQVTILLLYAYNVYRPVIEHDDIVYYLELVGLISFELNKFWSALSWHLLILIFSAVQYHLLTMKTFSDMITDEPAFKSQLGDVLPRVLNFAMRIISNAFQKLGPIVFFASVLSFIVFRRAVTIINLVFLVFFFISVVVSTIFGRHGSKVMYPLWMAITIWCSIVLVALYAFQFKGMAEFVEDLLKFIPFNEDILKFDAASIGLYIFKFKSFEMLPYAAFVLISMFVLKSYQVLNVIRKAFGGSASSSSSSSNDLQRGGDSLALPSSWIRVRTEIALFFKRLCILHQPKLLLVFLFFAAYNNHSILGLVFMVITCLFAPLPKLAARLWLVIMIYSIIVITSIYLFQFPFFASMHCNDKHRQEDALCEWFRFVGLKNYYSVLTPEQVDRGKGFMLLLLWDGLLVLLAVSFQRTVLIWKKDLKRDGKYQSGLLFIKRSHSVQDPTTGIEARKAEGVHMEQQQSNIEARIDDPLSSSSVASVQEIHNHHSIDEGAKLARVRDRLVDYLLSSAQWYCSLIMDMCNHFYERHGFGISLLALLLGSITSIQTAWGLLYLLLFGICFFAGRRVYRFWWLIVVGMELQLIVLFIFNIAPFPLLDYRRYLLEWHYFNYVFKYFAIAIDEQRDARNVFLSLYAILFFMALQARVFSSQRERRKNSPQLPSSTSALIKERQREQGRMHVFVDVPTDILPAENDFTAYRKPRNFVHEIKFLVFHLFPQFALVVMFFNSSAEPSLLRMIGASIALLFINLGEWLSWQGTRMWSIVGIYLYTFLLIQAIFQIPIVITREMWCGGVVECMPQGWQLWTERIINFVGLYDVTSSRWWLDVVVMALYWIQLQMIENPQYIYYTNFLHRTRVERDKQLERNIALRTAKFLKRFTERFKTLQKQKSALDALADFRLEQTKRGMEHDRKELIHLYRDIHDSSGVIDEDEIGDRFLTELRSLRLHPIIIARIDKRLREYLLTRTATDISIKKIEESLLSFDDVDFDKTEDGLDGDEFFDDVEIQEEEGEEEDPGLQSSEENLLNMGEEQHSADEPKSRSEHAVSSSHTASNVTHGDDVEVKDDALPLSDRHDSTSTTAVTMTRRIYLFVETLLKYTSFVIGWLIYYCDHFLINVAYDHDEHGYSNELRHEYRDVKKSSIERRAALLRLRLHQLFVTVKYAYRSHTDVICYVLFTLNMVLNPNIWNAIFTVTAFGFAAVQSPVPHKSYWLFMMYFTEALITLQYLLYLAQNLFGANSSPSSVYSSLTLIGWTPAQVYLMDIIAYPIILLALGHHRSVLKARGDWDQYIEGMMTDSSQVEGTEYDSAGEDDDDVDYIEDYYEEHTESDMISEQPLSPVLMRSSPSFGVSRVPKLQLHHSQQKQRHHRRTATASISDIAITDDDRATAITGDAVAVQFEEDFILHDDGDEEYWIVEEGELDELDNQQLQERPNVFLRMARSVAQHYSRILDFKVKIGMDLYALMVTIDILTLAVFFICYPYLTGRPTNDVTGALRSNELPGAFVIAMIIFFMLIIIDRIIYLYSSLVCKLLFQYFCVIAYHALFLYMFDFTQRTFNDSIGRAVLSLLFVMKCCYLFVSAVQIRKSYPPNTRVTLFYRSSHYLVYYVYAAWRAIPFLFELKTLLDWTFTKTTLTFYQWIKMEDIRYQLYVRKSYIDYLKATKVYGLIGNKQPVSRKATSGFLLFVIIMSLIFFPLLFYSTYNPVFSYNYIREIRARISVTGYETLYTGMFHFLRPNETVISFVDYFGGNRDALRDLVEFDPEFGIQNITLRPYSESYWTITEQSRQNLVDSLSRIPINVTLHYQVDRVDGKTVSGEQVIPLDTDQRARLRDMINGTTGSTLPSRSVSLPSAFTPFIVNKATGLETVSIRNDEMARQYKANCSLIIVYGGYDEKGVRTESNAPQFPYWGMECTRINIAHPDSPEAQVSGAFFDVQTRKIVQDSGLVGALSSFGIITFYTTFVLAVGRLLRTYVSGMVSRIFYEDLEDPDLLYAFCQECYLARAAGDLELEQMLTEQLIDIFRDTNLLQTWTRRKMVKED